MTGSLLSDIQKAADSGDEAKLRRLIEKLRQRGPYGLKRPTMKPPKQESPDE